jgi:hypothetical protein
MADEAEIEETPPEGQEPEKAKPAPEHTVLEVQSLRVKITGGFTDG